ncbi:hypothetical protein [Gordonia sihwensis]|uniref:hypothetical protein n=1 Tax=Gordonia sihwensis TaxID=173559 RepID=UPI003D99EB76
MMVYLPDKSGDDIALIPQFRRIIDLYGAGVLGDNAAVWIDPHDSDATMFWTLTDRSSLMYYLAPEVPGYVRITDGRVRWAPTYDGSGKEPVLDLDLNSLRNGIGGSLRLDAASNFTLVVNSSNRRQKTVTPVDFNKQEMEGGLYRSEKHGVTVIDLPHYTPRFYYSVLGADGTWDYHSQRPEDPDATFFRLHAQPSDYETSHAIVEGTALLTARMSAANRDIVRSNIKEHAVELTPSILAQAEERARGVFQALARGALTKLGEQLKDTPDLVPEESDYEEN